MGNKEFPHEWEDIPSDSFVEYTEEDLYYIRDKDLKNPIPILFSYLDYNVCIVLLSLIIGIVVAISSLYQSYTGEETQTVVNTFESIVEEVKDGDLSDLDKEDQEVINELSDLFNSLSD